MKKNIIVLSVWGAIVAVILALCIFLAWYASTWDRALTMYFGSIGGTSAVTDDELTEEEKELELQVVDEGCVLLQNDNGALPLSSGNKVSVFGITSQMWMTKEAMTNTKETLFLDSLEESGLEINATLRKFYKQSKHTGWGIGANMGNGSVAGTWTVDEVPQDEYTDEVKESYSEYGDAAIVVISRGGGEGGDLPRYMGRYGGDDSKGYLELTEDEEDLLTAVGSAGFGKVIVLLHTTNAMDMDFILEDSYNIDSVLWVSGTGEDGVAEMGRILTGEVNPSAKNVDTYVYDSFSAPAMQNFGDYRFTQGGELVADDTTTVSGGTYSYVNYGEGIYVGYRYYETRYYDAVTSVTDAGDYSYADTVYAPFGYGMSYADFEFSDFEVGDADGSGDIDLSVKITNTSASDVSGKEVAEFYISVPYTVGGIEKSAVSLIEFDKTEILDRGDSETVEVTVNLEDFASYDQDENEAYILEAGDYYFTVAGDAHEAVNNVLAAQGYTVADGMTEAGDSSMTEKVTFGETVYKTAESGNEVENLFEDAQFDDATYLSRADWSAMDSYSRDTMLGGLACGDSAVALGTSSSSSGYYSDISDEDGTVVVKEMSDELYEEFTSVGWDASGNPVAMDDASWDAVGYGEDNGLTCDDMVGVDYGDSRWDDLVNQMSQAEQVNIVGLSGWGNDAVESVGKPKTYYQDGPLGVINYTSSESGYQFTDANMLGATWNKELAYEQGDLISLEQTNFGASMWWAPGMNIHRAAYSGRNFEYLSEDAVHTAEMVKVQVSAAQSNGIVCAVKHFFMNDQESNRNSNGKCASFATEQSMREIYARPFRACIVEGGATAAMASMGRIGPTPAAMSYAALTSLLRGEWGLEGGVITDSQSFQKDEAEQALAAGCDMVLTTSATEYYDSTLSSAGGQYMLHAASKDILYLTVNSIAISTYVSDGFPTYVLILILVFVAAVIYLAYGTVEILCRLYPDQKILSKRGKWIMRGILWAVAAALLIYLAVMFFSTWLGDLTYALQNIS